MKIMSIMKYIQILFGLIDFLKITWNLKNFFEQERKNKDFYLNNKIEFDLTGGNLFEKELLLPIKKYCKQKDIDMIVMEEMDGIVQ